MALISAVARFYRSSIASSSSPVGEACVDCLKDNQDISAFVFALGLGIRGCTLSPAVGRLRQ